MVGNPGGGLDSGLADGTGVVLVEAGVFDVFVVTRTEVVVGVDDEGLGGVRLGSEADAGPEGDTNTPRDGSE